MVFGAGDVVVDGTLHCFGECEDADEEVVEEEAVGSQHLSCHLGDSVWTKHPDMPFKADDPAVWHLPPYIVVCGGVSHDGVHALHLETGEWEEWGESPVKGCSVAQCALSPASTFIHSSRGSFIATSGTVERREREAAIESRVRQEVTAHIARERERLCPVVQSTLRHLSAFMPSLDVSVDGYGEDILSDTLKALESGVEGMSGLFHQADIPSPQDVASLTTQLSMHCQSTLTADLECMHTYLGVAESATEHYATLMSFVRSIADGGYMTLATDYVSLHASMTAVRESLIHESAALCHAADTNSFPSVDVSACISQLSSVLDCLERSEQFSTLPLPPDVSALSDTHLTRYRVVVAHNERVSALVEVVRRLKGMAVDIPDTLARLQRLDIPTPDRCIQIQGDSDTSLGTLYNRMQEAADARQLLDTISSTDRVPQGRLSDLTVQRGIAELRLTHMRLSPTDRAKVVRERDSISSELEETQASISEYRRLCEMLKRHTGFAEVAEFFASHQYEHPLDRHNLAPYRPLFLDMPLSQLNTEPFPSLGRVPLLSGEHPSMGRVVLKKYCLSD
ncbi:hypothetical protein KIPB_004902, partial [Kipferlia bialata]|eukprot:g4902.t1